jgi:UDP-glucose 4-epimerase
MNILLTGGLGFIGIHAASVLVAKGHNPILLDNLCNSQIETLIWLERIAGKKLIYFVMRRLGVAKQKVAQDYHGIIYQSTWEAPM